MTPGRPLPAASIRNFRARFGLYCPDPKKAWPNGQSHMRELGSDEAPALGSDAAGMLV
jgi:hypothetical protein